MNKAIILIVVACSLFFLFKPSDNTLPEKLLSKANKCIDDKCLIVYLGHKQITEVQSCRSKERYTSTSTVAQMVKSFKEDGINTTMVLGGEHYRILEAKAKRYSFPVLIDYEYNFFDQYRNSNVPVIVAYNKYGEVLGAYRGR